MVHVVVPEWEVPDQELIQADAQAPQVRDGGVAPAEDHLWCHEDRCPLHDVTSVAHDALRDAEVDDLQVALVVNEAVLALEVQVRDPACVQELERQDDGAGVELGLVVLQQAQGVQRVQQLPAGDHLHQEVHPGGILEGPHKLDNEGVVHLSKDAAFREECILHALVHHIPLPHALQRVAQAGAGSLDHLDHAESTTANDTHKLKVRHIKARVLEGNPCGKVIQAGPLHDLLEGGLVHHPELAVLGGRDARGARIAGEQRALAEVVAHAHCPDLIAIDLNQDQALSDDVKVCPDLALREDSIAGPHHLDLQPGGQSHQLLLG
mmetsp:Transcript_9573/g.26941  ORF Transcript_9573/g.26941 Transcript_9573/m.26941 type:complete len:322 (+) Transcript_9573:439-1404(+)